MFAIYLCAIPMCIADCKSHRIPNIYLMVMFYVICCESVFRGVGSIEFLTLCALSLVGLNVIIRIGMGDVKLIFLICLALNLDRFSQLLTLLTAVSLVALATIVLHSVRAGQIPVTIALAPSIFIGTWLYLGARNTPLLQEYADALVNSW
ncbi:MAG: hypothetical protein F2893_04550 [Actinobacteria bacterium]|uniref:Unannotated protein n=2 Tax=freshwater metagenome TaxID=449393 RepID=A0A6J7PWD5_9ZZZZ|nr:hypothetical protein [Actinomycetota bacterium]MSV39715.1 hypothetical protein [Actinomycetota bacterium]MTH91493.1 hypothetical protein [Actinomycetota bacterium]